MPVESTYESLSPDTMPLWRLFFRANPYDGFDPAGYADDCGGWNSDHQIFRALMSAFHPRLVIEVGTWKGASVVNMATVAEELSLPTNFICIDTWLGTLESYSWRDRDPAIHDDLLLKNGWPHLYYQFISNVCRRNLQHRITPLPQTSIAGLTLLRNHGMRADLIYLDGSHGYDEVKADLHHAWECLTEDGVLFGDDYLSWPSVTQAVDEFSTRHRLVIFAGTGKFMVAKSGNVIELLGKRRLIEPDGSFAGLRLVHS